MGPQIFISHSAGVDNDNRAFLSAVARVLQESGFEPFHDKDDLKLGDLWRPALYNAMDRCRAAVVLVSERALRHAQYPWVYHETTRFLWRKTYDPSFQVIAVLMPNVTADALSAAFAPLQFGELQVAEWTDASTVLAQIVERLKPIKLAEGAGKANPLAPPARRISVYLEKGAPAPKLLAAARDMGMEVSPVLSHSEIATALAWELLLRPEPENLLKVLKAVGLELGREVCEFLIEQLAPHWVQAKATAHLDAFARSAAVPKWVVIDATQQLTGELYAGWPASITEPPWPVLCVTLNHGGDAEGWIVEEFRRGLCRRLRIFAKRAEEDFRLKLFFNGKPTVFVVIDGDPGVEALAALRKVYDRIVVIIPVGDRKPEELGYEPVEFIKPPLGVAAEEKLLAQYWGAKSHVALTFPQAP